MNRPVQDFARETAHSIKTLHRELRQLQAEYDQAPAFSFSKRMKAQIAEEIVRIERRKASYVKTFNEFNQQQRGSQQRGSQQRMNSLPRGNARPVRQDTLPANCGSQLGLPGWKKAQLQQQINALYQEIGALGTRISAMNYTPERKQLIERHKDLIRQRRQLILQVNQG